MKMELEIRDQPHEMWAEGTSDSCPSVGSISDAISKRGYSSSNVQISHDDMQGMWRFTADLSGLSPHAPDFMDAKQTLIMLNKEYKSARESGIYNDLLAYEAAYEVVWALIESGSPSPHAPDGADSLPETIR